MINYPYDCLQMDALVALELLRCGEVLPFRARSGAVPRWLGIKHISVVTGSPPCQRYSVITSAQARSQYDDLLTRTMEGMDEVGLPWVVENVTGARHLMSESAIMLCWSMFHEPGSVLDDDGTPLRMERHRMFDANWQLPQPSSCRHPKDVQVAGSYAGARRDKTEARHVRHGGYVPSSDVQAALIGCPWMTDHGLHQAIPPSYTEFIGKALISVVAGQQDWSARLMSNRVGACNAIA